MGVVAAASAVAAGVCAIAIGGGGGGGGGVLKRADIEPRIKRPGKTIDMPTTHDGSHDTTTTTTTTSIKTTTIRFVELPMGGSRHECERVCKVFAGRWIFSPLPLPRLSGLALVT